MKTEIEYYNYGQKFTIDLTIDEIKKELQSFGVPNINRMSKIELIKQIKEIYQ